MVGLPIAVGTLLILLNLAAGVIGGWAWWKLRPSVPFWYLLRFAQVAVFIQAALGGLLLIPDPWGKKNPPSLYAIPPLVISFIAEGARLGAAQRELGDLD